MTRASASLSVWTPGPAGRLVMTCKYIMTGPAPRSAILILLFPLIHETISITLLPGKKIPSWIWNLPRIALPANVFFHYRNLVSRHTTPPFRHATHPHDAPRHRDDF